MTINGTFFVRELNSCLIRSSDSETLCVETDKHDTPHMGNQSTKKQVNYVPGIYFKIGSKISSKLIFASSVCDTPIACIQYG